MSLNSQYTVLTHHALENKKIVCLTLDVEGDYGTLLPLT